MTLGKPGLGSVGFLIVVMTGVMAFASNAQAALVFRMGEATSLHASVTAQQVGTGVLLVAALNLEIRCTKFTPKIGLITNSTHAEATLLYEECKPFVHSTGKENPFCHIAASSTDTKLHITAKGLLLPAELLSGAPAILVEKLATLVLFLGAECTMPEDNLIGGDLCLAVDENDTVKPLLLASSTIQGSCKPRNVLEGTEQNSGGVKDQVKYGANQAQVVGSASAFMVGAHEGIALGVGPAPLPTTRLCKAKTGSCEPYANGTKLSAGLENEVKFVFFYEGEKLEPPCKVSTMSGATTKEGKEEAPIIGEITALSFEECGGGLCPITSQNLPYKFEIKATSEGNGTMTWSSGGSGSPAFSIKCLGLTKCIYGAATMTFTFTGGTPAKLSNSGVALKREAGSEEVCGESGAEWKGVAAAEGKIFYKITSPNPLFVRLV